ncbi:MAG: hypothetical protein K2Q14_01375, partial [Gammaproteobacteria bacterium]|nr:hypothetical protein [Gammaproteobacteria bacterium]
MDECKTIKTDQANIIESWEEFQGIQAGLSLLTFDDDNIIINLFNSNIVIFNYKTKELKTLVENVNIGAFVFLSKKNTIIYSELNHNYESRLYYKNIFSDRVEKTKSYKGNIKILISLKNNDFISGGYDGAIYYWESMTMTPVKFGNSSSAISALALFDSDIQLLVSSHANGDIKLWSVANKSLIYS